MLKTGSRIPETEPESLYGDWVDTSVSPRPEHPTHAARPDKNFDDIEQLLQPSGNREAAWTGINDFGIDDEQAARKQVNKRRHQRRLQKRQREWQRERQRHRPRRSIANVTDQIRHIPPPLHERDNDQGLEYDTRANTITSGTSTTQSEINRQISKFADHSDFRDRQIDSRTTNWESLCKSFDCQ